MRSRKKAGGIYRVDSPARPWGIPNALLLAFAVNRPDKASAVLNNHAVQEQKIGWKHQAEGGSRRSGHQLPVDALTSVKAAMMTTTGIDWWAL